MITNNTVTFPVPSVPTDSADSSARKRGRPSRGRPSRGRPFQSGLSGNPNGRPKGARNKATLAAQALIDGDAEAITLKGVELAKAGNIPALRLCFERIVPPRRDRLVTFDLPEIKTAGDAAKASSAVLAACAEGTLSTREAADFMALLETHSRILGLSEIEDRLIALEKKVQP